MRLSVEERGTTPFVGYWRTGPATAAGSWRSAVEGELVRQHDNADAMARWATLGRTAMAEAQAEGEGQAMDYGSADGTGGLAFGPSFRWEQRLWTLGHGRMLARLVQPKAQQDGPSVEGPSPSLVDAVFQVAGCAAAAHADGAAFVPFMVGSVRWNGSAAVRSRALHVVAHGEAMPAESPASRAGPFQVRCDVCLLDGSSR